MPLPLFKVKELLDAQVLVGDLNMVIHSACGSDLMSDCLAFVKDQTLLLTGLTNPQVIRTAELLDVSAIVFVRGKTPQPEVLAMAEERSIALLTTQATLYVACGKLYQAGLPGGSRS